MKHLLWDKTAIKELGEPIIYSEYQTWLIGMEGDVMTGFMAYEETNKDYLVKYLYVLPEFRRLNIASQLYQKFEASTLQDKPIKTVTTHVGLAFFNTKGFEITKEFVNYFKIEKK